MLTAVTLIYFVFFFDKSNSATIAHFTFIETVSYLIPMILGGLAKEEKYIKNKVASLLLIVLTFSAYVYQSFRPFSGYLTILQPLIGLLFAYGLGCFLLSIDDKLPDLRLVRFISDVTLECYLVQFISRSAFTGIGFPTNIVFHVICTIAAAYCLHWVSDLILRRLFRKPRKDAAKDT